MTYALARSLLLADAVKPEALAEALLVSATRGTSLVRALVAARAIDPARLDMHLERGDVPTMRHVVPVLALVQQLPSELCDRLLALPVRQDPLTNTVDVAVVDARDPHAVEEMGYWLRAPVRMIRTSLVAMESALRQLHAKPDAGMKPLAPPIWVPSPMPSSGAEPKRERAATPMYGTRAADGQGATVSHASNSANHSAPATAPDLLEDLAEERVADPASLPGANIPILLRRKSIAPVPILEVGAPPAAARNSVRGEPHTDPILDLRRMKSVAPPEPAGDAVPPAPITTRGPFSPGAPWPPFGDVSPTLEAIRSAADRDTILELLVSGMRPVAPRVAVLAVKRDLLMGWTCSPEMGDRTALRSARMAAPPDSVLSAALATDDAMLARIPTDAAHAPLLAAMQSPPLGEVALVAVRVEGKPVALVVVDEPGDSMSVTKRMQELAHAAAKALGRLLRDRRK
jgi:MshEN domain